MEWPTVFQTSFEPSQKPSDAAGAVAIAFRKDRIGGRHRRPHSTRLYLPIGLPSAASRRVMAFTKPAVYTRPWLWTPPGCRPRRHNAL